MSLSKDWWLKFFKPGTRAFIGEARRTPNYSLFDWLHGYVYARWPYLYIGIGTGEHPLARWLGPPADKLIHLFRKEPDNGSYQAETGSGITFADTYHGKVVPLEAAKQLVNIKQEISLTNLETVIPYNQARDIVMKHPDHIVVLECPCRASRPNPCSPLEVCLVVGEPMAGFMAEHHPRRSRWISSAEAVEILQAEHERGHVHHAFFKDAMLGRFYAICNCCACCCGAMQARRNGIPMLASSGYLSRVDELNCVGCGLCADYCQFGAISLADDTAQINEAFCMGCGVCVDKCPQEAISIRHEPSRGMPLEMDKLLET